MSDALTAAVGARVALTTTGDPTTTLQGRLYSACPVFSVLALETAPHTYRLIPFSQLQTFSLLPSTADDGKLPPIPEPSRVDISAASDRLASAIRARKEAEARVNKSVDPQAQALFDALARMYPARWKGRDMVVSDAVVISPPYTAESCAAPGDKGGMVAMIRRVLEGERRKLAAAAGPIKGG